MSGRVTFLKVVHSSAPRSMAASSSERLKPLMRARIVTTTKLMQNIMWAMTIVGRPRATSTETHSASSDAPMITSGVAIGHVDQQVDAAPGRGTGSASAPGR